MSSGGHPIAGRGNAARGSPDSYARATAHQTVPGEYPGDAQVALRRRAWQQRRMTAPATLAEEAAGETGYRQRASNPSVRSHERLAGRGHRWMMGRASAPTESGLSPLG